jgi:hypothetical protein
MVGGQGGFDAGDEVEVEAVGVESLRGVPAGVLENAPTRWIFPHFLRERDGFPCQAKSVAPRISRATPASSALASARISR